MRVLLFFFILALAFSLEKEDIRRQALELIPQMADLKNFPTYLEQEKVRAWILEDSYPKGKLYFDNEPFDRKLLSKLISNANVEGLPERIKVGYGITLRRTNLKLLPTQATIHKGNPDIDYNQYTSLDPFVPLVVLHNSKDENWLFVQSSFMRGWIKREDVKLIGRTEFLRFFDLPFLVVLKPGLKVGNLSYSMGSRIPYLSKASGKFLVLMPDGSSQWIGGEGLSQGHWEFSQERAKLLLDSLLGYPYQWGGYYDCSALVRALFGVFGLELPRNSYQQALVGEGMEARFGSYKELKEFLRQVPPYKTVLYMKGHIMVFGGLEEEDVVVYHSVYGIKKDNGEHVYPKAVVKSSLEKDGLTTLYSRIVGIRVY